MILQIVEIGAFLKLDLIAPWGPGQMFVAGGPRGEDVTEAILRGASEVWMLGWDDGMMWLFVWYELLFTHVLTSVLSYGLHKATILWFIAAELDSLLGLQVLAPNGRLLLVANLANVDSLGLGDGICLTSRLRNNSYTPEN